MDIDYNKLREVIEVQAIPLWENPEEDWYLRVGGGEAYAQDKVLKNAVPHLTQENLRRRAKESVLNALKAHVNLLSQFESMYARTFIEKVPENDLRDNREHPQFLTKIRKNEGVDWFYVL